MPVLVSDFRPSIQHGRSALAQEVLFLFFLSEEEEEEEEEGEEGEEMKRKMRLGGRDVHWPKKFFFSFS